MTKEQKLNENETVKGLTVDKDGRWKLSDKQRDFIQNILIPVLDSYMNNTPQDSSFHLYSEDGIPKSNDTSFTIWILHSVLNRGWYNNHSRKTLKSLRYMYKNNLGLFKSKSEFPPKEFMKRIHK